MCTEKAKAQRPEFVPAWVGLAELYIKAEKSERWTDLEEMNCRPEAMPHRAVEGATLRARGYLGRKDFTCARALL